MKSKILLFVMALPLLWASCSKKTDVQASESTESQANESVSQKSSSTARICLPGNGGNPWDSVGIHHNLAMAYAERRMNGQTPNASNGLSYTNQYVVQQFGASNPDIEDMLPTISVVDSILADSVNSYANIIKNSSPSRDVQDYFTEIMNIIEDTKYIDSVDYCDIKSKIIDVEERVKKDKALSQDEIDQILRAASIARHSFYYWNKKYMDGLQSSEISPAWQKTLTAYGRSATAIVDFIAVVYVTHIIILGPTGDFAIITVISFAAALSFIMWLF